MDTPVCNVDWQNPEDFFRNPDGQYILLTDKEGTYNLVTIRLDGTGEGLIAWDESTNKYFEPYGFTRLAIVAFLLTK